MIGNWDWELFWGVMIGNTLGYYIFPAIVRRIKGKGRIKSTPDPEPVAINFVGNLTELGELLKPPIDHEAKGG